MAYGISVGQLAYEKVKALLGDAHWRPGAQLDISTLAGLANVSATPMREALHRLAAERLVELRIGHGFFVLRPSEHELRSLYRWWGRLMTVLVQELRGVQPIAVDVQAPLAGLLAASRDPELVAALTSAQERRRPYRAAEAAVLGGEAPSVATLAAAGDFPALRRAVARHVASRVAAVPAILAAAGAGDIPPIERLYRG